MRSTVRQRLTVLTVAGLLASGGCYGGDSSPEEPAGGGVPPRGEAPQDGNVGQSEGFPDSDAAGEAQQ